MDFEIWDSRSGNMLFSTPDLDEALTWAFNFWLREGQEAVSALSIGDEQDQWVASGAELRDLLLKRMWQASTPWVTSAGDRVVRMPPPNFSSVGTAPGKVVAGLEPLATRCRLPVVAAVPRRVHLHRRPDVG
jgi:hypothetical protein